MLLKKYKHYSIQQTAGSRLVFRDIASEFRYFEIIWKLYFTPTFSLLFLILRDERYLNCDALDYLSCSYLLFQAYKVYKNQV